MALKSALLPLLILSAALPVEAATFLIDFGVSTQTTTGQSETWNNFTGTANGFALLNLQDTEGDASTFDLTYTGATLNTVPDNTNAPSLLTATPAPFNLETVIIDSFFQGSTGTFTLSELNPLERYSFTFYAYVNRTGTRLTDFSINGTKVSIEPARTELGGKGGIASINEVQPNAAGNIVFTVSSGAGTNWIFNAVQITSVPEPSTALLVLAGAATWGAFRRRRG